MELFSLEVILCVSHVTFNENIIFCYLICVSPPHDICLEYRTHSQLLIQVFTVTAPLGDLWRLTHVGCSELAYNGIYPDGHPSRSTTYTGLYPDGDSSGSPLKDGDVGPKALHPSFDDDQLM